MSRPTATALADVRAGCQGCDWTADTINALGLAAIHHDRTGHVVNVHIERTVVYGDADAARQAAGQTTLEDNLAPHDRGGP